MTRFHVAVAAAIITLAGFDFAIPGLLTNLPSLGLSLAAVVAATLEQALSNVLFKGGIFK